MDATSAWDPRLVLLSVFHFSIRKPDKSRCMACEVWSSWERSRFTWLTDAYGTGPASCGLAGDGEAVCAISGAEQQRSKLSPRLSFISRALRIRIFREFVNLPSDEWGRGAFPTPIHGICT